MRASRRRRRSSATALAPQIANVMDKFEAQFDNLDVRTGYMDKAMASSTATSVPEDDVDRLMDMVRETNAHEFRDALAKPGSSTVSVGAGAAAVDTGRVAEGVAAAPAPPTGPAPPGGRPGDDSGSGGGGGGALPAAGGAGGSGGGATPAASLEARLAALRR